MKFLIIPLIGLLILVTSPDLNAQNESCYLGMAISNPSYSERPKVFIRSSIRKIKCPNDIGYEPMKQDVRKQFFYYLYDNHNSLLTPFKVDPHGYMSYNSINPFFGKTKAEVLAKMEKHYTISSLKSRNYTLNIIEDFEYEHNKFTHTNYPNKELFAMLTEINNYFKKGIKLNR